MSKKGTKLSIIVDHTSYKQILGRSILKGMSLSKYIQSIVDQIGGKIEQEDRNKCNLTLSKKIDFARDIIYRTLSMFPKEKTAIAWTGGKDSTLILSLIRDIAKSKQLQMPKVFFIDEGDTFPEINEFVSSLCKRWNIDLEVVHNKDVSKYAKKVGDSIKVSSLNKRNQEEIKRLEYNKSNLVYEPESLVGNHLMKTVPLNLYLEKNKMKCFFEGIRWDEQEARATETFFSHREKTKYNPQHTRVFPILHFSEKDVWDAIQTLKVPVCNLYKMGYRSLGARTTTTKISSKPAWEQDLKNTKERGGRRQDKENMMGKLRSLGYM